MSLIEKTKRVLERATGLGRPTRIELAALVRARRALTFRFRDDDETPNNRLPLVVYRNAVARPDAYDPAAVFEDIFAKHGWQDSWRDGIYPFNHFHTQTHEVLGFARGHVRIQFGGTRGRTIELRAGDVAVLPAGTGHRRRSASRGLLVVGAYPANGGEYDEPKPKDVDHGYTVASIRKVKQPRQDPVYGAKGPLLSLWRKR